MKDDRRVIMKAIAGSRLYGTHNENSDTDYKIVFAHSLDDLITVASDTDRTQNPDENSETEWFSLRKFGVLLGQSQTVAVELLFLPRHHILETSDAWEYLVDNRDKIISKDVMPFVGYARNQARIYSNKGDRLGFLRKMENLAIHYMTEYGKTRQDTCVSFFDYIDTYRPSWFDKSENANMVGWTERTQPSGVTIRLLEVLGKGYEENITIGLFLERIGKQVTTYGERAKLAETNTGHDVKATYHAIRVIREAIELVTTGNLTFPRPEVQLLRDVRAGKYDYSSTCDLIQDDVAELERVLLTSTLQDKPDKNWIMDWASKAQRRYVLAEVLSPLGA